MPPFVSVIIPAFNQEAYLPDCLDSVLAQSGVEFEVIVIDDGSTDRTRQIAIDYQQRDSRIRVFHRKDCSAGAARNFGIGEARGRYLHFLDSDDWLEPEAYARLAQIVRDDEPLDLVLFNYFEFDNTSGSLKPIRLFPLDDDEVSVCTFEERKQLLLQSAVVPWNKLLSRDYVRRIGARFDELPFANDRTFHFKVVSQAGRLILSAARLINYRTNNASSLAGHANLERGRSTLEAFRRSLAFSVQLDPESRAFILERGLADFASLYRRAKPHEKLNLARLVMDEQQTNPLLRDLEAFRGADWYATFCVMRSVVSVSSLNGRIVPLVMATNLDYVPYLVVTLQSISDNLAEGAMCVVHVLHTELDRACIEMLEGGLGLPNIRVFCVDLSGMLDLQGAPSRAHISREMYYRLWIPELLDFYEKVIYIDCDLIVNGDLAALFQIDIKGYDLGAVRDLNNAGHKRYVEEDLGLDAEHYVNSGVIVFDTWRCKDAAFRARCLSVLDSHEVLNCPDQDMINVACEGRIKLLDGGWNYLWQYGFAKYRSPPDGEAWFKEDLEGAQDRKYIIHYSSAIKPWAYPLYEDAQVFWAYARKTPVYGKICSINGRKKAADMLGALRERIAELRGFNEWQSRRRAGRVAAEPHDPDPSSSGLGLQGKER